jgi:predicted PurR-regulated permease PerM
MGAVVWYFSAVLLPIVAALLVAYVIAPLVERISRFQISSVRVPRWGAILLIYFFFFLGIYAFSVTAIPRVYKEVVRMANESGEFISDLSPTQIAGYSGRAESWLNARGVPVEFGNNELPSVVGVDGLPLDVEPTHHGFRIHFDLVKVIDEARLGAEIWTKKNLPQALGYARAAIAAVGDAVFVFFFTLMVSAFVLLDLGRIHRFFSALVPIRYQQDWERMLQRVDERLSGVVRGQLIICLVNGVLTLIGLLILKVKYSLVLALIATLLSLIPIFGSIISTIPIVLVAVSQNWEKGALVLLWVILIHALEAYFLNPRIMGTAAKIHPALIAFSLLVGERTFGFTGALLAVPAASIFLGIFEHLAWRARQLDPDAPTDAPPISAD